MLGWVFGDLAALLWMDGVVVLDFVFTVDFGCFCLPGVCLFCLFDYFVVGGCFVVWVVSAFGLLCSMLVLVCFGCLAIGWFYLFGLRCGLVLMVV